jgi:3-dehydroquinate synthase
VLSTRRVAVISDHTVSGHYRTLFEKALEDTAVALLGWIDIEPGETSKTVTTLSTIWDRMIGLGMERGDMVVAFGGGVVGDIAGFAAATYMRGIDFVQVPTTLLAMVDSSVGGKTAVDHECGKNLIGAFHQPKLVVADLELLETLPHREVLSGMAELIKAAILGDETLFELLEAHGPRLMNEPEALEEAVSRAVAVKAKVVADDEREGGQRALLNLGHTFGHAVEAAAGFTGPNHGEAVAMGIAFAVTLAQMSAQLSANDAGRIRKLLEDWGYELRPSNIEFSEILKALRFDKKREGGKTKWVLPLGIGKARWGVEIEGDLLEATFDAAK